MGEAVGASVGGSVGAPEGDFVGASVGLAEGEVVGDLPGGGRVWARPSGPAWGVTGVIADWDEVYIFETLWMAWMFLIMHAHYACSPCSELWWVSRSRPWARSTAPAEVGWHVQSVG